METHRFVGSRKHLEIVLLANIKGNFAPIHLMKINYRTWQIWCITTCISEEIRSHFGSTEKYNYPPDDCVLLHETSEYFLISMSDKSVNCQLAYFGNNIFHNVER